MRLRVGAWSKGLPNLAVGSDERLRTLAQLDLANPTEGTKQAELGDAWWGFSENSTGRTKMLVQNRATEWYQLAQHNLTGIALLACGSMRAFMAGASGTDLPRRQMPPAHMLRRRRMDRRSISLL